MDLKLPQKYSMMSIKKKINYLKNTNSPPQKKHRHQNNAGV